MNDQARPGWYPDGEGNERYWDGGAWTDQFRAMDGIDAHSASGAFSKLGAAVKKAATTKMASRREASRRQAEDAVAAGGLVTRGVFGTSTVEIFDNGYVRVASWPDGQSRTGPKHMDKDTPYEKLRSIRFTQPDRGQPPDTGSAPMGALGTAVSGLLRGGTAAMKAHPTGLAVTAVSSYVASSMSGKSLLTIATDRQIHTLTNQVSNALGLKSYSQAHNDVGLILEADGNAVLGITETAPQPAAPESLPSHVGVHRAAPSEPTLSDRLRELAELHKEAILSDEEYAAAKAKVLGGL